MDLGGETCYTQMSSTITTFSKTGDVCPLLSSSFSFCSVLTFMISSGRLGLQYCYRACSTAVPFSSTILRHSDGSKVINPHPGRAFNRRTATEPKKQGQNCLRRFPFSGCFPPPPLTPHLYTIQYLKRGTQKRSPHMFLSLRAKLVIRQI